MRILLERDDLSETDRAELHKLQEQFVAMQEMFAIRLTRPERLSPLHLTLIEGRGEES